MVFEPRPMANDRHSAIRPLRRGYLARLTAGFVAFALAVAPLSAQAQENSEKKGPRLLRDTEIEQLLRDYARPVLRAAGLEKQNIQVSIINDPSFNAFVADGRRIFVNYGALMQSTTPNQLIWVLAHETGHLAGGHLSKLRSQLAQAQTQMIVAMLLGVGAMVAGGGRNSGSTNAGLAAIAGPQEMIRRNLLSYQRQQEENADRAGVRFLNATGQSAKGMYETFRRFTEHEVPFTIATDGPEMMGTHLRDEFALLHRIGALDEDELGRANERGHEASFIAGLERAR